MSIQGKHFGIFCIFFLIGIVVSAGTVSGAETCDSKLESSYCGSATDVTILSSVPTIASWDISPTSVNRGSSFTAYYYINNPHSTNKDAWLGASIRKKDTENVIDDPSHDKVVTLTKGAHWYSRTFRVKADAAPGSYDVILGLHGGKDIGSGAEWCYTKWQNKLTVTQPPANAIPTLSNGYVTPLSDVSSTTFTYFVTYKDSDGDAPVTKSVNIDGSGGSHSHTMTYVSGSYSSGAIYKYKSNLPLGGHSYYFHFSDGKDDVNFPSSGTSSGPSVADPTIANNWYISPTSVNRGSSFTAYYYINNPHSTNKDAWLGASIRKTGTTNAIDDPSHDKVVTLTPGTKKYSRTFRVKADAAPGSYDVILGLHGGKDIGSGAEWCYTKWQNELTVTQPLTNLVVTIQSPTKGFSVSKGTPTTVSAKITDNLEKIIPGASLVKATFTNGDDDLVLLDDGAHGDGAASDGVYANTWTPQTTAQGYTETACTIKVTAYHSKLSSGYDEVNGVINYPKLIMIELTPSSHDFCELQTTVSTAPFSFTLKNVGGGTATGDVSLTGSGKDQFIITSGKGSFSLDADQTKTIGVAFSPTSAGSKSATLYAKGSNCNDDQSSLAGTGEEGVSTLSADFTIEPSQNINLGDVVTFDASSSTGDIFTYFWDFGDGESGLSSSSQPVKHLYMSSGTFSVELTVTDYTGNSKNVIKAINVGSKYENAILEIRSDKYIGSTSYSYDAIYTKYAPLNVRVEKYSNTEGLSGIEVGSSIKNDVIGFFTFERLIGMAASECITKLIELKGYVICPLITYILLVQDVSEFIEHIDGYSYIESGETDSNGKIILHIPYESARISEVEDIADRTPGSSIEIEIDQKILGPDNLQFQETPEQLIYIYKENTGLSKKTVNQQKFAYMKKIDPSDLPEGITFYYEPDIQKKENRGDTHPKLEISVKRQIKDEDIPLIDVSICIIVNDMCQSLGSTSSDGSLRLTEDELVHIDPHGTYTLVAGDGIFYSRKKEQFTFNNDGTTHVDIVLDKKDLPTIPSYVAIFAKTPQEYPNIVTYPHANSIKNFLQNKCIYTEYIDPTNSEIRKNPTTLNEKMQAIISGSDWIIVLCSFEDIQKPFADFNPHFKFSADKKKPEDVLKEGTGWKIIKYNSENIGLSGETSQYLYYIVTEDKTNTVETAVKEFLKIIGEELGGSDGLDQLISTSIETSPDPPSTNFGTVPEDQTRTWDFFITNSGSDTLTWTISCDQPWLNVNPASGSTTTLDVVTVTIDTRDLTPGTYTGHVTITSNDGNKTGTVTVEVPPPESEPKLCTSPDPPSTNFGTVPEDQTRTWDFFITNCGSGTLTWAITCDQPSWLNVNPAMKSTTTLDVVTATINTHDLSPGTHTGHITLTSNGGRKIGTITVTVPPPAQEPTLCTSPDPPSTNFGTVPEDQTRTWDFFITNCGSGTLTWTITCDQPSWLIVNPAMGSTTTLDVVTVTIDTHDLSPGTHTGHITLTSNGGEKTGTITVNVPEQIRPNLCTSPDPPSHDFGTVAKDQTRTWDFDVRNCGSGTLTWSVSDDKNWMSVYPTSGSTTKERDTVIVRIDTHGLSPGTHTGHITLTSNGGEKTGTITVVVPKPQNQPPENPTLTPDRSSPQLAGTTIKWTASATDPDGDPLYYQFGLKGPATGNSWTIKRDWSTARRWTWYATASDAGENDISVRIRDGHHASKSSYDLKKTVYDYKITADKKRPTATIDSITPNPATQGKDTVRFKGHGYDSDGYIVEYYWKSSKDGKLSSSKEFRKSASNLDVGTHTVSFKVKDDDGQWSDWATKTLKIEKKEESKYVKFRGVVTGISPEGLIGGIYWYVNVDKWISGSLSCDEIFVGIVIGPEMGSYDPDISTGDRVEVYGNVNPGGADECSVGLNGESYYIKKTEQTPQQNCKVQITSHSSLQDRPSIVYANGYYYVAYQSHEKGYGIFLEKFNSNWKFNKKVEVASGSAYYDSPSLLFANNKLYVAYVSNAKGANANDYDVIVKEYDPSSLSCTKGAKYLTSLQSCQDLPALYYKDGYFYMAYQSWETGNGDIYIKKFDSSWKQLKKVRVASESSLQDRPSITYADGCFYVAYFSKETGNYDIFVQNLNNDLIPLWGRRQITSESSSQSYPFITFVNNQFVISYASTESGTLGIYMKKYSSTWNYIEKTKVIDSSAYERRPSHTWDGSNFWVAYVYNYGDSKDWNIFAITPDCEGGAVPIPTPLP